MDTKNRLQFRHHSEQFDTREAALDYIKGLTSGSVADAESGLASKDKRYGFSLLAEPTILTYKNEEDEKNPHVMLVIGSYSNESGQYANNRFCVIDIDMTEQEIKDLDEKIEEVIASLGIVALSSKTINMYAEQTDDGTVLSGDVRVSDYEIIDDERKVNKLLSTDNGLFVFVDMSYDKNADKLVFQVNDEKKEFELENDFLVSGEYSREEESLILTMKKGEEIKISLEDLIDEWTVLGDASDTPIVLVKETYGYGHEDESHYHVEPWQDILKADVRVASNVMVPNNILKKTDDGRYLFVDGKAANITYYNNGEKSNVKAALDQLMKIGLSNDGDNIIVERADGYFASAKLSYDNMQNKLTFKVSGQDPTEIKLNSINLFEDIYYDPVKEELVLIYKDAEQQVKRIVIPIGEIIQEWQPMNEGHSVTLVRSRSVAGKDEVSADVKILSREDSDNILEEVNHELYVKGTSDNIKHGEDSTVKREIEKINEKGDTQEARIDDLEATVGTGFSTDTHETVSYKFELLSGKTDTIGDKIDAEIVRSTEKDAELSDRIDQVNNDRTVNVMDTESVKLNMTDQTIGKMLSADVKVSSNPDNIVTIDGNGHGVFASVDLDYDSANDTLTLSRNGKPAKVLQLVNESAIIDIHYDEATNELVIIYKIDTQETKEVRVSLDVLADKIDEVRDELDAEITRSTEADNTLTSALQTETNRAMSAETALQTAVSNEATRAQNAESAITHSIEDMAHLIDDEKTRAENAEAALQTSIENASGSLQTTINNAVSSLTDTIEGVDSNLKHLLDDEENARSSADSALADRVTALEEGIGGFNVQDSQTIDLIYNDNTLSAEVKLANGLNNMLITEPDHGIYATVDLDYDGEEKKLLFTRTDRDERVVTKEIDLSDGTDIDIVGSETYSTSVYVDKIEHNDRLKVDVRMSHGNPIPDGYQTTDEEIYISAWTEVEDFTDTNVLRMANFKEDQYGNPLRPESECNGIYLSNVWDCGLYTENGEGTARNQYRWDDTVPEEGVDYNNYARKGGDNQYEQH